MFDIINNLDMIKSLGNQFKGLTTIGIATILATVISGVFWFYIAALLGTTHYGEVSYIIAISGITLSFVVFGSGNSFLVYIAKGVKIQPPVYFISIVSIGVVSVILYFIFYDIGLSLVIIGNGIFGIAVTELLGLKLYKKYSQYLIIQRILMVFFAISLYYIIGINGIIIGIGLSYFPAFLRVYQVFKDGSRIDFSLLKTYFRFMLTSYTLDITRVFATTVDKIIVAPMLGFALLGNYQLGVQVLSVLMLFPGILYNYILPHDASGNSNNRLKKLAFIFSFVMVIPTVILSPTIIPITFPKFTESISIIQIMSISIIPITIISIYVSKFLGNEKIRIVLIGSGIFLIIQITTIFALVGIFGINGVAASYVIATTAEATYLIIVNHLTTKNKSRLIKNDSSKKLDLVDSLKNIRLDFSFRLTLCSLIIIGVIGLALRLYNFPYNIPLILDAYNGMFLYATDVSILGHLPSWPVANNGWPLFLSFFFSVLDSTNFLDYMNLQRIISMSLSILTIIPLYFLCRKFFNRFYSVIGVALFAFEPHIIQNSLLGLTEPLFIILVTSSITLFLRAKTKFTFLSFAIIGLATIVRMESVFVFFAFSISFLIQNRHERKFVIKYLSGLGIFLLTLFPFILLRIRAYGEDFISSRIIRTTNDIIVESVKTESLISSYLVSLENIVKLSGWSLIPYFVVLMPIGIYLILRKRDRDLNTILIIMIFMFIAAAIAFSMAPDTRYIYPMFSLLCIVSVFPIRKFVEKFNHQKILVILIIGIILFSSISYLEIKKYDLNHQREAVKIVQHITSISDGFNGFYPEDGYIISTVISEKWPMLKNTIHTKINAISTYGFDSLEEYIKSSREKGLTHLVVDDNKKRPGFLIDIFEHEDKYPYLVKVYDSADMNFTYHVKVFEINYNEFDKKIGIYNEKQN